MSYRYPFSENSLDTDLDLNTFNPNIVRKEPLVFPRSLRSVRNTKAGKLVTRTVDLFAGLPPEPEDAVITGATRSLYRRLLALNLNLTPRLTPATVPAHTEIKIA